MALTFFRSNSAFCNGSVSQQLYLMRPSILLKRLFSSKLVSATNITLKHFRRLRNLEYRMHRKKFRKRDRSIYTPALFHSIVSVEEPSYRNKIEVDRTVSPFKSLNRLNASELSAFITHLPLFYPFSSPKLDSEVLQHTFKNHDNFTVAQMAHILYAFTKRFPYVPFVKTFRNRLIQHTAKLTLSDIAEIVYTFSYCKILDEPFMHLLALRLEELCTDEVFTHDLYPSDLHRDMALLMYGLANLNLVHPAFFREMSKRVQEDIYNFVDQLKVYRHKRSNQARKVGVIFELSDNEGLWSDIRIIKITHLNLILKALASLQFRDEPLISAIILYFNELLPQNGYDSNRSRKQTMRSRDSSISMFHFGVQQAFKEKELYNGNHSYDPHYWHNGEPYLYSFEQSFSHPGKLHQNLNVPSLPISVMDTSTKPCTLPSMFLPLTTNPLSKAKGKVFKNCMKDSSDAVCGEYTLLTYNYIQKVGDYANKSAHDRLLVLLKETAELNKRLNSTVSSSQETHPHKVLINTPTCTFQHLQEIMQAFCQLRLYSMQFKHTYIDALRQNTHTLNVEGIAQNLQICLEYGVYNRLIIKRLNVQLFKLLNNSFPLPTLKLLFDCIKSCKSFPLWDQTLANQLRNCLTAVQIGEESATYKCAQERTLKANLMHIGSNAVEDPAERVSNKVLSTVYQFDATSMNKVREKGLLVNTGTMLSSYVEAIVHLFPFTIPLQICTDVTKQLQQPSLSYSIMNACDILKDATLLRKLWAFQLQKLQPAFLGNNPENQILIHSDYSIFPYTLPSQFWCKLHLRMYKLLRIACPDAMATYAVKHEVNTTNIQSVSTFTDLCVAAHSTISLSSQSLQQLCAYAISLYREAIWLLMTEHFFPAMLPYQPSDDTSPQTSSTLLQTVRGIRRFIKEALKYHTTLDSLRTISIASRLIELEALPFIYTADNVSPNSLKANSSDSTFFLEQIQDINFDIVSLSAEYISEFLQFVSKEELQNLLKMLLTVLLHPTWSLGMIGIIRHIAVSRTSSHHQSGGVLPDFQNNLTSSQDKSSCSAIIPIIEQFSQLLSKSLILFKERLHIHTIDMILTIAVDSQHLFIALKESMKKGLTYEGEGTRRYSKENKQMVRNAVDSLLPNTIHLMSILHNEIVNSALKLLNKSTMQLPTVNCIPAVHAALNLLFLPLLNMYDVLHCKEPENSQVHRDIDTLHVSEWEAAFFNAASYQPIVENCISNQFLRALRELSYISATNTITVHIGNRSIMSSYYVHTRYCDVKRNGDTSATHFGSKEIDFLSREASVETVETGKKSDICAHFSNFLMHLCVICSYLLHIPVKDKNDWAQTYKNFLPLKDMFILDLARLNAKAYKHLLYRILKDTKDIQLLYAYLEKNAGTMQF